MTTYSFWIWRHKLLGIVYLLTQEAAADFTKRDYEAVLYGLSTATEQGFDYTFIGEESITIQLMPNNEDGDVITISVNGSEAFLQKVALMDRFQASFQGWIVQNESYYTP